MTMTISHSKFFGKKKQQKLLYFSNCSLIIFLLGLLLYIFCRKEQDITIQSIKTTNGWGYVIKSNGKTIIKQSIIPAISADKSFTTEKEALAVGQLVVQKLNADYSPTITKNDLILLKIKM